MTDRKRPIYINLIVVLMALLAVLFGCAVFVLHLFGGPDRQQKTPASENSKPPEQVLLGGGIAVRGRHVILYASRQQTGAASLVGFADDVLEYYAGQLGIKTPAEPIHVYLLDTQADYYRADTLYNNGTTKRNFGFARHGNVYLYVRSRPGQPITEDSKTGFELAHELCHAIHQRMYSFYNWQPSWLLEGVANVWAEQATIHRRGSCADRLLAASTDFVLLRQALASKQTLSIAQILEAPPNEYGSNDDTQRFVSYAKSFALIRMLNDPAPANAPRRALFRSFLKQINGLDSSAATQDTNRRFLLLFGGAKLATLQSVDV